MDTRPRSYPETSDDPAFLACVDRIISGIVARSQPEEVYVVRIDNWFDHKWLTFSGKGVVFFDFGGLRFRDDVALDEFHMDQITFPPFNMNRVRTQSYFCKTTKGYYEEQSPAHLIHRAEQGHSAANLTRRVVDLSKSAVFLWFSSETAKNGRGSLMVYSVREGDVLAWFASFRRDTEWRLLRVKGASREDVNRLLQPCEARR
jgi:hypothetical protein